MRFKSHSQEFSSLPSIEGQSALVVPLKADVGLCVTPGTEVRARDTFWSQLHTVREGFVKVLEKVLKTGVCILLCLDSIILD